MLKNNSPSRAFNYETTLFACVEARNLILDALKGSQEPVIVTLIDSLNKINFANPLTSYLRAKHSYDVTLDDNAQYFYDQETNAGRCYVEPFRKALSETIAIVAQIDQDNLAKIHQSLVKIAHKMKDLSDTPSVRDYPGYFPVKIGQIKASFFDLLLAMAERLPRVATDPISKAEIKDENRVYSLEGHQFDICELVKWHNFRKRTPEEINTGHKNILNTITNQPFLCQGYLERKAKLRDLSFDELELKVKAFKMIYAALYNGQTSFFKPENFLLGKKFLQPEQLFRYIEMHIQTQSNSTTSKAWELAQKHFRNCDSNNTELFNEIYKFSFEKSGIFKWSSTSVASFFVGVKNLSAEQIKEGQTKKGSRREAIGIALGKSG